MSSFSRSEDLNFPRFGAVISKHVFVEHLVVVAAAVVIVPISDVLELYTHIYFFCL